MKNLLRQKLSLLLLVALFAAPIVVFVSACSGGSAAVPAVTVRLLFPTELHGLMQRLQKRIADHPPTLADGQLVRLELSVEPALAAARKVSSGELKPDAWIVSSPALVGYTNSHIVNLGAPQVECKLLFTSPLVVAMHSAQAERFAKQGESFSWRRFTATLARQAGTGRPIDEIASLVVLDPRTSISGFSALLALDYLARAAATPVAAAPDSETAASTPTLPAAFKSLAGLQQFVTAYPLSEDQGFDRIVEHGTRRLAYLVTSEREVALANQRASSGGQATITALYPEEGTVWQEYSLCRSQADWVSPAHVAAIGKIAETLRLVEFQELAGREGFRPLAPLPAPTAPLLESFGVQPLRNPDHASPPDAAPIIAAIDGWQEFRRPSATLFVLDRSAAAGGATIQAGQRLFRRLFATVGTRDRAALMGFSDDVQLMADFGASKDLFYNLLDSSTSAGDSALADALMASVRAVQRGDLAPFRKNIVIFTAGRTDQSKTSPSLLNDTVRDLLSRRDVTIVAVVPESSVDTSAMKSFIGATHGTMFNPRLDDIERFVPIIQTLIW